MTLSRRTYASRCIRFTFSSTSSGFMLPVSRARLVQANQSLPRCCWHFKSAARTRRSVQYCDALGCSCTESHYEVIARRDGAKARSAVRQFQASVLMKNCNAMRLAKFGEPPRNSNAAHVASVCLIRANVLATTSAAAAQHKLSCTSHCDVADGARSMRMGLANTHRLHHWNDTATIETHAIVCVTCALLHCLSYTLALQTEACTPQCCDC